MVGKNSQVPAGHTISPGAKIPADIQASDYPSKIIQADTEIKRGREIPYEV
jgi:hypothetical protein